MKRMYRYDGEIVDLTDMNVELFWQLLPHWKAGYYKVPHWCRAMAALWRGWYLVTDAPLWADSYWYNADVKA